MKIQMIFALLLVTGLMAIGMATATETLEPQLSPPPQYEERELPPGTGFIPPPVDLSHLTGQKMPEEFKGLLPPPVQYDWRSLGKVTPVKNQSTCGACYAFAALANFESKMLIDGAGTFDFSENHAKECNWYDRNCTGGSYWYLTDLFSKTGTVLESCDPYVAWNTSCNTTCPYIKTLLDWRRICGPSVPSTAVLKSYIQTYGPVYTVLYVGDASDPAWQTTFNNYNGSTTLYYTGSYAPNHSVCIVGWDDNLVHAGGTGGWIVKNSWGTAWGGTCGYGTEKGYFTIAYGSANVGWWAAYLHSWQNYDTNGNIFFYDDGGWTQSWGYGTNTAWGMCKFVPGSVSRLTRVEFWTTDVTTDIDVYVYDTFSGGTLSALLTSELDNSFSEVGYHSVALSSPPTISSGNDVYVVVKFANSTTALGPVAGDNQGTIETNKTYISHNGIAWTEMGTGYGTDVAIRLRTTSNAPAIAVHPDTLKFGQVTVGEDSAVTMRVRNTGTDTLNVTDVNRSSAVLAVSDTAFDLAPAESTTVTVTFSPAAVQNYSETLTILHNAKGSTVVPVVGQGTATLDLIIAAGDIQFDPSAPVVGDTVTIRARVHHDDLPKWKAFAAAVDSVLVRFYDGNPAGAGAQIGTDQLIPSIEPDSSEVAQVQWATQGAAGGHQIYVLVDPDDDIVESSESNNQAHRSVTVLAKPQIVSLVLSDPTPTAAGAVSFTATFDRAMDTGVAPVASYGLASPYGAHAIAASTGWSTDSLSWVGADTILAGAGDGLNTVSISAARDAGGHAMDTDTSQTFFIDTVPPTSQASSPRYSGSQQFQVSWSGADPSPGCGVASYDVTVMVDGLFPALWLDNTTNTSGIYSGSNGHYYSYYTTAADGAGNEESAPGAADCTTWVDTQPPAVPALVAPADNFVTGDQTPTLVWKHVTKAADMSSPLQDDHRAPQAAPVAYQLQVSLNAGCTNPVVDTSGLADTSFTVAPPLADNRYFWRVQAHDLAGHVSGFQPSPRSFRVDTQPPLISGTIDWPDTSFGGPFTVETTIGDPSNINLALLWYRTDGDTIWQADTMAPLMPPMPPPTHWGIIPEQATPNTAVEYYVYAEDGAAPANSQTDPIGAPGTVFSFTAWATGVVSDEATDGLPETFALYQNYPNPFNASTEIRYDLPWPCHVRVDIFNILGQRIITLANGDQQPGYHILPWDGRDAGGQRVASGVYLYRLCTGQTDLIRKLVVLQ